MEMLLSSDSRGISPLETAKQLFLFFILTLKVFTAALVVAEGAEPTAARLSSLSDRRRPSKEAGRRWRSSGGVCWGGGLR